MASNSERLLETEDTEVEHQDGDLGAQDPRWVQNVSNAMELDKVR